MGEVETPEDFEDELDEVAAAHGMTKQQLAAAALDHAAEDAPPQEDELDPPLEGEAE